MFMRKLKPIRQRELMYNFLDMLELLKVLSKNPTQLAVYNSDIVRAIHK